MKVGLTYDLRAEYLAAGYGEEETAEFDRPDTIDAIEHTLQQLGYQTDRIGNIRQLVPRLAAGDRWDIVFNIAEGLRGLAREAQIPALLQAYDIPCTFSDPLIAALTLHKALTKRILRDVGVRTPEFAVVETEADIARVNLPFPLFVKPLAEGTAKGVDGDSKVTSRVELDTVCRRLLARFRQPALVEMYLPGREFTVGHHRHGR
jgi:D-alanine-D-alanine ligase